MTERESAILLNLLPALYPTRVQRLVEAFGTLRRACHASADAIAQTCGFSLALAESMAAHCRRHELLEKELARAVQAGVHVLTRDDASYPPQLLTIADPPLVLYVRGALPDPSAPAMAIVGARLASAYGLTCAEQFAQALAQRGITIVSGFARGIDAAAHRGAIAANGQTIAVLGGGFEHLYPSEHAKLADIIAQHGAVISEYPMQTEPLAHHFPRRNRVISGLSLGVIVVEAGARSGALITADMALEQGRDVFAVPGPIHATTSAGTNHLLKQGARMVTSVDDIFEELDALSPPQPVVPVLTSTDTFSSIEAQILSCVEGQAPSSLDAIASRSGIELPRVSAALMHLELQHAVQQLPGKRFIRR